jgi:site-specific DNA-methyltransferase (adenine-specific)
METNKIYQGDCLDELKKIPDNSIDLIVIDPPYSTPVITAFGRKKVKNYGDLSMQKGYFKVIKEEFKRILKEQSGVFIFCDYKYFPILFEAFYDWQTSQLIIWDKMRIGMGSPFRRTYEMIYFLSPDYGLHQQNGKTYRDIMQCKPIHSSKRYHGAEKPVELIKELIDGFCPKDGIVLDCFCGSGSTCVASKILGRKYIGIDINEEYCNISKKRISEILDLNTKQEVKQDGTD